MKTYQEYYEEWQLSTESRDLAFDEWLMVQLARKEKQMINKACKEFRNFLEKRVDNPHYQLNRSDFDNWVNDFRSIMEE